MDCAAARKTDLRYARSTANPLLKTVALRDTMECVIESFRHVGLKVFFETGSKAGIQPAHANKLSRRLLALNNAKQPEAMNVPGWDLHPLTGNLAGHWSVKVNANWRMTFRFEEEDAVLLDYQDYH